MSLSWELLALVLGSLKQISVSRTSCSGCHRSPGQGVLGMAELSKRKERKMTFAESHTVHRTAPGCPRCKVSVNP